MRRYWGTSPIGSRRTKPPINTPDAGVTGAGWSGGHGRASRSTTPSLPPLVWRSHGRPGPTVPRKPAAPQVPTRRSNGGRAERRPTQQREGAPVTGHNTRYGARHPLRGTTPRTRHHTRYEALHPLRGTTPDQKRCTAYGSGAHPITRTNAESARRSPTRRQHAGGQLLMLQTPTAQVKTVAQGANLDGPDGERTGRPGRGCRGCREIGK